MKRLILGTLVVLAACLAMLICLGRWKSVICAVGGTVSDDHGFMLLNPFRNRGPESASEQALSQLKEGRCLELSRRLSVPDESAKRTCQEESTYPVQSWTLTGREDTPQSVRLRYRVKRRGNQILVDDPIWTTVDYLNGNWQVRSMEAWY